LQYGAASAVDFGLYIRLIFIMAIGLGMFTTPFWPALINARMQRDHRWLIRSLTGIGAIATAVGVTAALIIAFGGPLILKFWAHVTQKEGVLFNLAFGFYFFQWAWSHYWATVLMGFGREKIASRIIVAEGLLIGVIGSFLSSRMGPTGMIIGLNIAFMAVSTWLLPLLVLRRHARGRDLRKDMLSAYRRPARIDQASRSTTAS
jgi:O-antigen/teichoic acid export membrane protein